MPSGSVLKWTEYRLGITQGFRSPISHLTVLWFQLTYISWPPYLFPCFQIESSSYFLFFWLSLIRKSWDLVYLSTMGSSMFKEKKNLIIGISGLCSAEFMLCHKLRHILGFLDSKSCHPEIFFSFFSIVSNFDSFRISKTHLFLF